MGNQPCCTAQTEAPPAQTKRVTPPSNRIERINEPIAATSDEAPYKVTITHEEVDSTGAKCYFVNDNMNWPSPKCFRDFNLEEVIKCLRLPREYAAPFGSYHDTYHTRKEDVCPIHEDADVIQRCLDMFLIPGDTEATWRRLETGAWEIYSTADDENTHHILIADEAPRLAKTFTTCHMKQLEHEDCYGVTIREYDLTSQGWGGDYSNTQAKNVSYKMHSAVIFLNGSLGKHFAHVTDQLTNYVGPLYQWNLERTFKRGRPNFRWGWKNAFFGRTMTNQKCTITVEKDDTEDTERSDARVTPDCDEKSNGSGDGSGDHET